MQGETSKTITITITNKDIIISKPTNFSIPESLEVIWEAINEWELDIQSLETKEEREDDIDNVKTSMAWIEDALGLKRDKHGDYVEGETA